VGRKKLSESEARRLLDQLRAQFGDEFVKDALRKAPGRPEHSDIIALTVYCEIESHVRRGRSIREACQLLTRNQAVVIVIGETDGKAPTCWRTDNPELLRRLPGEFQITRK
jgi:hypothetical protein